MNYRNISASEISELIKNGCTCDDWSSIQVRDGFSSKHIKDSQFSGNVKIGLLEKTFHLAGGVKKHSCITNAVIHNCTIGDNVVIENIQNYIANYTIGDSCFIQNVDVIYVEGNASFGQGTEVRVLNETGGREVYMTDKLSSHFAYIFSLYRHRPNLTERMKAITDEYCKQKISNIGQIESNCEIVNVGCIKNVNIGAHCVIQGAMMLKRGTIISNETAPVYVGRNVIATDFIVLSGSKLNGGTIISRSFIGQACMLDKGYSASDSLFFSNCHGENGEACALFAGPFTVTHHKSTLLISGMFSFMNAGSGSNQSNHMYKLGPIHQGIIERGAKTTSNSYMLWPAKVGPFSLIIGRHTHHSDTSNFPFSYLLENNNNTHLVPAINLKSVGTIRDAKKWPERDMRKDPDRLDYINFNLLSPYTIQKVFNGVAILEQLQDTSGKASEMYIYQSCIIKNASLTRGLNLYEMVIHKFLGNSIIKRLETTQFRSNEEIRKQLAPDTPIGIGEWLDISGLIAPKSEIETILTRIEIGEINDLGKINDTLEQLHKDYYSLEWTWAWDAIQKTYNLTPETITAEDVINIVCKWKDAVIGLDRMIYEDARKEFSLSFKTGFGADGNIKEQAMDFESVRGAFDNNPFVNTTLKHIKDKDALGNELIERMEKVKA